MPGCIDTIVGYAGGTALLPNYDNLHDYIEVLIVIYDPEQLHYRELLEIWSSMHDPCTIASARQYQSAIVTCSEEQKIIAKEFLDLIPSNVTELLEGGNFYKAEEYHQHYIEKNK